VSQLSFQHAVTVAVSSVSVGAAARPTDAAVATARSAMRAARRA
jgi:hypothetical protein